MRTTDRSSAFAAPASHRSLRLMASIAAIAAIAASAGAAAIPVQAQMARTPALAAPATSVTSAQPTRPALDDPTIVAIFDAANSWDIEAAHLALKKSHNKDVRAFAQMMAHDHQAVRKMGRDLAKKLNVTPTPPGKDFALYQSHLAAMKTLRATKRGPAFDKAYIDNEVAFHQAVIDAVTTTLLPATQNAELKNLETTVAPNFQAHLLAAKKLQGELVAAK